MITAAESVNMNMSSVSCEVTAGGQNKVYVPVRPMNVVYTQLDHVAGVPTRENQGGVTVSKAQILNSLIDQLLTMDAFPETDSSKNKPIDPNAIDEMIDKFKHLLETTIQAAHRNGYGLAGVAPQPGVLFSIDA